MINKKILLASGSPRRAFLLNQLDIAHRIIISDVDEIVPDEMIVGEVPVYLAELKGNACLQQLATDEILLAADTIVVYENDIIGKPANQAVARETLRRLSGTSHEVISGVFLTDGRKKAAFSVATRVTIDTMTDAEIEYYVKKYQPLDKAGSYGIQEWIGWAKIERIEGSYSNIMGLPTRELFQALKGF